MQYSGHMKVCDQSLYTVYLCVFLFHASSTFTDYSPFGCFCPLIWVAIENANNRFGRFEIMIAIMNRQLIFSSFQYTPFQFNAYDYVP